MYKLFLAGGHKANRCRIIFCTVFLILFMSVGFVSCTKSLIKYGEGNGDAPEAEGAEPTDRKSSGRRSGRRSSGRRSGGRSGGGSSSTEPPSALQIFWSAVVFHRIAADSFTMGSPRDEVGRNKGNSDNSNENQVNVTIRKSFEIMETEVTQRQWYEVMQSESSDRLKNPSYFKNSRDCADHEVIGGIDLCPNHPVEEVTWNEVKLFIKKLNTALGLTGCDGTPQSSRGCYRLPTEAEWELSARKDTTTAYFFGDNAMDGGTDILGRYAWYRDNIVRERTHKVGQKLANPNGLKDIYGNVWEWVEDLYTEELPGGTDPLVTESRWSARVVRGGSWIYTAEFLRSAERYIGKPNYGDYNFGFRLVRTL